MADKHGNFYQHGPWMKLRRQVRIANNFTCSTCGKQVFGRELHAHHRKPVANARSLALEPQNIRLLCRLCHNAEHGRGRAAMGCDADGNPRDPAHPWNKAGGTRIPQNEKPPFNAPAIARTLNLTNKPGYPRRDAARTQVDLGGMGDDQACPAGLQNRAAAEERSRRNRAHAAGRDRRSTARRLFVRQAGAVGARRRLGEGPAGRRACDPALARAELPRDERSDGATDAVFRSPVGWAPIQVARSRLPGESIERIMLAPAAIVGLARSR
jgi:hypothetical protein